MANRYETKKTGSDSWSVLDRWSGMYVISDEDHQVCCNIEASLNAEHSGTSECDEVADNIKKGA